MPRIVVAHEDERRVPDAPDSTDDDGGAREAHLAEGIHQKTAPPQLLAEARHGVDGQSCDQALPEHDPEGMDGQGFQIPAHLFDLLGRHPIPEPFEHAFHVRRKRHARQKKRHAERPDADQGRTEPRHREPPVRPEGNEQALADLAAPDELLDDNRAESGHEHVGGGKRHACARCILHPRKMKGRGQSVADAKCQREKNSRVINYRVSSMVIDRFTSPVRIPEMAIPLGRWEASRLAVCRPAGSTSSTRIATRRPSTSKTSMVTWAVAAVENEIRVDEENGFGKLPSKTKSVSGTGRSSMATGSCSSLPAS